jgi:hypothetical protein
MQLTNSEGKRVPEVSFRTRQDGQWKDVATEGRLRGQDGRPLRAARRLHADLLEHPPAALQRARPEFASSAWTRSSAFR